MWKPANLPASPNAILVLELLESQLKTHRYLAFAVRLRPLLVARQQRYSVRMTTREKAEQLLKGMPDEQVPVALEALEAVERYAQTLKVLRARAPKKSERELMESLVRIKEGDDAIEQIGARFAGVDPEEIEREAVKAVRGVRAERTPGGAG
jgi:hypothetical protein